MTEPTHEEQVAAPYTARQPIDEASLNEMLTLAAKARANIEKWCAAMMAVGKPQPALGEDLLAVIEQAAFSALQRYHRAALARLESDQQWRPMEEAPKDGSSVIIAHKVVKGRWIVCESYHDGSRRKEPWLRINTSRSDEWFDTFAPTKWRPLPEPPGDD